MFEERKSESGRQISFSLFSALPPTVRAFLVLFVIVLVALFVFGFLNRNGEMPAFENVTNVLTDGLKLIIGAVLGALSAEGSKRLYGEKPQITRDEGSE